MLYGMFYIQIIHGLALGLYSTYYYLCSIIFYNVLQLRLLKLSEVVDPCSPSGPPLLLRPPRPGPWLNSAFQYALIRNNQSKKIWGRILSLVWLKFIMAAQPWSQLLIWVCLPRSMVETQVRAT